jgi:hypothetical protein
LVLAAKKPLIKTKSMAVDNNQKLLIGLAVVAVALYFVNQKTDPKTAERRDDLARTIKKQPMKADPGETPAELLYRYLTDTNDEYQKFQVKFGQFMIDLQVTGSYVWPLPETMEVRAEKLRAGAEELRNTIQRKENAARRRTTESTAALKRCEAQMQTVSYLLNKSGEQRNAQQVQHTLVNMTKILNLKIEKNEGDTTISNEWNSTKELHIGGGIKRTEPEGFNQSIAPSTAIGPPTAAKAQQIAIQGGAVPKQIGAAPANYIGPTVALTAEDKNDGGAALIANAQPGNKQPPSVPLPASPRVEKVELDEYASNEGNGAPSEMTQINLAQNTVAQNPAPVPAVQDAAKPSLKRAREEVNFVQGGDTGDTIKRQKAAAETVKPANGFNDARRDGTTSKVPGPNQRSLINGAFAAKLNDLRTEYLDSMSSVKRAGLALHSIYELVPLGNEETGWYTNITTRETFGLEKGPNNMFQRLRLNKQIPENEREVAQTVRASPEYKRWRTVVAEIWEKQKKLQDDSGGPEEIRVKAFYQKL